MKQLIIFVIAAFILNSYILNWSQIIISIDLLKCCQNLATLLRAQAVKQFAYRFFNISCSGRQVGELFFLFGKSKSCIKTYVDFKLEKNLSPKLLNVDKTYDFVIKPLKKSPPGNHGNHIFFSRNWYSHNQHGQLKKFEKNLSSASVDDEHP